MERFDTALGKLEKLQQRDFEGILRAMSGLPVIIRLIDPPLHEFLPNHEDLLTEIVRFEERGTPRDDDAFVKARVLYAFGASVADALMAYVKGHSPLDLHLEGRITRK